MSEGKGANVPDMCVNILDCSKYRIFSGDLKVLLLRNVGGENVRRCLDDCSHLLLDPLMEGLYLV